MDHYDQNKRCPRCQRLAPALKHTKLDMCIYCSYPASDPRYDPFFKAQERVLEQSNKRRM